jgi:hypothetical protein
MKTIAALMIIFTLLTGGCEKIGDSFRAKPVEIEGLGSLSALAQRDLSEKELAKTVETVAAQNRVTEEDSRAMLEIYKRQTVYFAEGSGRTLRVENILDEYDVEPYLRLLMAHEPLREELQKATIAEIIDQITGSVSFEEKEKNTVASAGFLAAVYHNAYGKTIAKSDEKLWEESYNKTQATNEAAVVAAFERAAHKYIVGGRGAGELQKTNARQFVEALKIYDESLPSEKILDSGGRLVDLQNATPQQIANISLILHKTANETNPMPLDKAFGLLQSRMHPAADEIEKQTNMQAKRRLS